MLRLASLQRSGFMLRLRFSVRMQRRASELKNNDTMHAGPDWLGLMCSFKRQCSARYGADDRWTIQF